MPLTAENHMFYSKQRAALRVHRAKEGRSSKKIRTSRPSRAQESRASRTSARKRTTPSSRARQGHVVGTRVVGPGTSSTTGNTNSTRAGSSLASRPKRTSSRKASSRKAASGESEKQVCPKIIVCPQKDLSPNNCIDQEKLVADQVLVKTEGQHGSPPQGISTVDDLLPWPKQNSAESGLSFLQTGTNEDMDSVGDLNNNNSSNTHAYLDDDASFLDSTNANVRQKSFPKSSARIRPVRCYLPSERASHSTSIEGRLFALHAFVSKAALVLLSESLLDALSQDIPCERCSTMINLLKRVRSVHMCACEGLTPETRSMALRMSDLLRKQEAKLTRMNDDLPEVVLSTVGALHGTSSDSKCNIDSGTRSTKSKKGTKRMNRTSTDCREALNSHGGPRLTVDLQRRQKRWLLHRLCGKLVDPFEWGINALFMHYAGQPMWDLSTLREECLARPGIQFFGISYYDAVLNTFLRKGLIQRQKVDSRGRVLRLKYHASPLGQRLVSTPFEEKTLLCFY